ncbi:uncharacterized protein LOC121764309 [Salvia splendens]|uniref:uncharacterized protein LOC121764309 n=1 Tax=Salvia splendens TaxID=180675 RepID=UPI001C27264A|nr:uncharacterized protein LOC121764309 [Salvia splendens]
MKSFLLMWKMERLFKKIRRDSSSSTLSELVGEAVKNPFQVEAGFDLNDIVADPGQRKLIEEFDVSIQDRQGLPFRGHDESSASLNRGNFLELLLWFSEHNDVVSKVLGANAPANNQMNSPRIQKDLANACASEVTLAIVKDIGHKVFTLLVDEARDVSLKEQMRVVLRYVNNDGYVIERILGIVHVTDTCSHTLKSAIDDLLVKHNLSLFKLIIVVVAKGIRVVKDVFNYVSMIVNMVVDLTIQEMDNRFPEISTELLRCISCLDSRNLFAQFRDDQIICVATLYNEDFSPRECLLLSLQLSNFIANVRCDPQFAILSNLGSVATEMVKSGKHLVFPLGYQIIELALVLPIATASVERAFSAMKMMRNRVVLNHGK